MKYRREIDGLRALAVIPVILFHAGFKTFSGGFIGVDIFFVISGYLITTVILNETSEGSFSIVRFYERRARRILPALFLVLFISLPFAWFWLLPQDFKSFSKSLAAISIFGSNFYFWKSSDYFDTTSELKPLIHTWSLSVEEQYYLLFPLLLLFALRQKRINTTYLFATISLISFFFAEYCSKAYPVAGFYLLHTRAWELIIGAIASLNHSRIIASRVPNNRAEIISILGLILIAIPIFTLNDQTPFPGIYALAPTLGTLMILVFSNQTTVVGQLLGGKILSGIGLCSYSAYLWHQPIFAFARHASLGEPDQLSMLMLILITIPISYLSWRFVESPWRQKNVFTRKSVFLLAGLGTVFFASTGLAGSRLELTDYKFSAIYAGDIGHLEFHKYISDRYYVCSPKNIADQALKWDVYVRCMQSKPSTNLDVALLGDSHAEHLFIGIAETLTNKNVGFYIKGTAPFYSNKDYKAIYDYVVQSKSIETVIFSMYWFERSHQIPKGSSFKTELTKTLGLLSNAGKKIYLIEDVPDFSFSPEACKYKGFCKSSARRNHLHEADYLADIDEVSATLPSIKLVPLKQLFCDQEFCNMTNNGVLMYRDQNHLNIYGSQLAGREIVKLHGELIN